MEQGNDSQPNPEGFKIKPVTLLILLIAIIGIVLLLEYLVFDYPGTKANADVQTDTTSTNLASLFTKDSVWTAPDSSSIPNDDSGKMILYGRALIMHTTKYFGLNGSVAHITNGMNCQNCHLEAGAKPFGNNYGAVASVYPRFMARLGNTQGIEGKVNDCFERSMNGKAIDTAGKEMKAIVAYIKWLGQNVKKGETPRGSGGIIEPSFIDRSADPEKGKLAFNTLCTRCHGADGQGQLVKDVMADSSKQQGGSATAEDRYFYPPLWGPNSYNNAASMYRLSKLAGFIKNNMPWPTTYLKPVLTDEQAWDIAAYVNSMKRPQKDVSKDWPDISKKAYDVPFGPYADNFTEDQHKYGPYSDIPSAKKKK